MRKPRVANKYNLKPKDIEKAVILDYDRLTKEPFWRNDVIHAWCLSGGVGEGYYGGYLSSYWIGFYDKDAKHYAGKIRMHLNCYEDMCSYEISEFYKESNIDDRWDLELQEKYLEVLNWLIDEKIVKIGN